MNEVMKNMTESMGADYAFDADKDIEWGENFIETNLSDDVSSEESDSAGGTSEEEEDDEPDEWAMRDRAVDKTSQFDRIT